MDNDPSLASPSSYPHHYYGEEVVEDGGGSSDTLRASSHAMPFQSAWSTGHGGIVGPLRQQEPADDVPLHQEATLPIPILAPHYDSSSDSQEKGHPKRHDLISQGAVVPPPSSSSSSLQKRPAPPPPANCELRRAVFTELVERQQQQRQQQRTRTTNKKIII
jgi:hypothetical protein